MEKGTNPLRKHLGILAAAMLSFAFTACSETDDEVEEYPDWENTNVAYFNSLYSTAQSLIESGDASWKIIKTWSMVDDNEYYTSGPEDYIIVEVLTEGTGSGSPIYTDNVWVHYRGRLLPSTSYPEGYIFGQSFYGEFNEATAVPSEFAVSGVVDGFATALQNMCIGDEWRIYVPYQLGYGSLSSTSVVPDYSTLIFEIQLVAYARADADEEYIY